MSLKKRLRVAGARSLARPDGRLTLSLVCSSPPPPLVASCTRRSPKSGCDASRSGAARLESDNKTASRPKTSRKCGVLLHDHNDDDGNTTIVNSTLKTSYSQAVTIPNFSLISSRNQEACAHAAIGDAQVVVVHLQSARAHRVFRRRRRAPILSVFCILHQQRYFLQLPIAAPRPSATTTISSSHVAVVAERLVVVVVV